jgi:hypothetical protein
VLCVSPGGEITAQPHRDGSGGDLGKPGENDDARGGDSTRKTSGEGEWNGQAIGETDDDIPDDLGGLEVLFYMGWIKASLG